MGDENSLQGQTRQHTHSAPSSDGGFLSTAVTGVTNLSNGALVTGDASEILTEIPAGNLNDVLTMGATLPSFQPPSAGSTWELLDSVELPSGGTLESGTFSAKESLYVQIYAGQSSSTNQTIKFNGNMSALYSWRGWANNGAQSTRSAVANGAIYLYNIPSSTNYALAQIFISNNASTQKLGMINTVESDGNGNTYPNQEFCWFKFDDSTNAITSIQWGSDSATPTTAKAGSYMKIYGC